MVKKSDNENFKEQFNSIFVNNALKGNFCLKNMLSSNYSLLFNKNNWWLN